MPLTSHAVAVASDADFISPTDCEASGATSVGDSTSPESVASVDGTSKVGFFSMGLGNVDGVVLAGAGGGAAAACSVASTTASLDSLPGICLEGMLDAS